MKYVCTPEHRENLRKSHLGYKYTEARKELLSKMIRGINNPCYRHGFYKEKWYITYQDIKTRCTNPNHQGYPRYGGRGIKLEFSIIDYYFLRQKYDADSMNFPTIHRINVDGNYTLTNCIFLERTEHYKLHGRPKGGQIESTS